MNDYDVVIVGGRAAGASTALLLARAGLRVAVVERSRLGADTVSTHALMRGRRPAALPVGPASRAGGGRDSRDPPHRLPLRRRRGRARDAAARPLASTPCTHHAGTSSIGCSSRQPPPRARTCCTRHRSWGCSATATGGSSASASPAAEGGEVAVRAGLTVGADGLGSLVAREVGAQVLTRGRAASAMLYRYVDQVPSNGYVWAYGASAAAAGLIPTNAGQTCVFVSTTPARMRTLRRDGAEAAFDSLLDAVPAALSDAVRAGRTAGRLHGWRGAPGQVRRSYGPGWALVGDAGYFKDPITTHGITDALRDAELLSDAALEGLGGASPVVALARYEATRDRLSRALFEVTESVCRYDWNGGKIRALLRRVSSAMSDELDHLSAPARSASR